MSRICENCKKIFHSSFIHAPHITRKNADNGYVYLFCSEQCAQLWTHAHKNTPPQPPLSSLPLASSQSENSTPQERWVTDGGPDPLYLSLAPKPNDSPVPTPEKQ